MEEELKEQQEQREQGERIRQTEEASRQLLEKQQQKLKTAEEERSAAEAKLCFCKNNKRRIISSGGCLKASRGAPVEGGSGSCWEKSFSSPSSAEGSGLVDKKVSMVDCGQAHTTAVTRDGSLWLWGRGHEGQLGLCQVERLNVQTILSAQACCPTLGILCLMYLLGFDGDSSIPIYLREIRA